VIEETLYLVTYKLEEIFVLKKIYTIIEQHFVVLEVAGCRLKLSIIL